ncbi:MAG: hypothetical protein OEU32_16190 [Acidimicrobiia bacterium]|nr:hypothetical protein [Acidimicrobiia bacterium]
MTDVFLSPARIPWAWAIVTTIALLSMGQLARFVGFGRDEDIVGSPFTSLVIPGLGQASSGQFAVVVEAVKSRMRPASVLPLVIAPMLMMRPPADIATVLVLPTIVWWALFFSVGFVRGQRLLRG